MRTVAPHAFMLYPAELAPPPAAEASNRLSVMLDCGLSLRSEPALRFALTGRHLCPNDGTRQQPIDCF